jgi:hypothetical protein
MMAKVTKRERLLSVCRNITAGGNVDADAVSAFKSAVLRYADLQHITPDNLYQGNGEVGVAVRGAWDVIDASNVLKELDDRERSSLTGASYPRNAAYFLDLLTPDDDDDERDDNDDDDAAVAKADRGGPHSLTAALLDHLHDRLERRREQHGYQKREEGPLDQHQELISIMKNCGGPVGLCKGIIDRGRSPCDEHSLVAALTKAASDQYPSLRPDTAFAQLYQAEESVRRACNFAKAAGPMFDVTIVHPGDETRRTVNDTEQSEAYQTLQSLADKLHAAATGKMSKQQAFAAVFTDPANRELSSKAHRRPTAPVNGAYPWPVR